METSEILSAGSVTNLAGLIEKCNFPKHALFLAEHQPSQIIRQEQRQGLLLFSRFGDLDNPERAQDFTNGRIFSDTFELRWEKESDAQYHVIYFGPKREISGLSRNKGESENIKHYQRQTKYYYLFGERLNFQAAPFNTMNVDLAPEGYSYYATARIPRLLLYPTDLGARRVQLRVLEYVDEMIDCVRLFRFQDLVVPLKGEEKQKHEPI